MLLSEYIKTLSDTLIAEGDAECYFRDDSEDVFRKVVFEPCIVFVDRPLPKVDFVYLDNEDEIDYREAEDLTKVVLVN